MEYHAYSGPWGYHLYLNNDAKLTTAQLESGMVLAGNFLEGVASYHYGQTSGNTYPVTGSVSVTLVLDHHR